MIISFNIYYEDNKNFSSNNTYSVESGYISLRIPKRWDLGIYDSEHLFGKQHTQPIW